MTTRKVKHILRDGSTREYPNRNVSRTFSLGHSEIAARRSASLDNMAHMLGMTTSRMLQLIADGMLMVCINPDGDSSTRVD